MTLAGTLTLPPGPGPFPAAILITGSGPEDRDETLFGHKPFAVLADHLTRAGIAVLRYDDRGTAASTGAYAGATSADFATDANAAFAFLGARPEIDRRAIGFIGHSEGGMIAPLAARDNGDVAFFVLLAAPGTRIPLLMEAQRRAVGRSQGVSDADLDRSAPVQNAFFAAAASEGDADAVAARLRAALTDDMLRAAGLPLTQRDQLVGLATDPWFRYFARYDPTPALAAIHVPVLALNGSLDEQVVARDNLAGIRAALAGHRDVTVRELPGAPTTPQTPAPRPPREKCDKEGDLLPGPPRIIANRKPPPSPLAQGGGGGGAGGGGGGGGMITIYGIKNCDTMKKARAWLDARGVAYDFHDYKIAGIDARAFRAWAAELGWEKAAQPRRHDLPQAARRRQGRPRREQGDRADAGPAVDDQAARARPRRPPPRRLRRGGLARGVRLRKRLRAAAKSRSVPAPS